MSSLLAKFFTRIKGSQEDIASEGLAYILQRSKNARIALSNIIRNDCGLVLNEITYSTQNIGEHLERPDISGINSENKEVIIIEAKFWASLTANQPIEYLNRLKQNSILIFICPSLRVRTIYNELIRKILAFEPGNLILNADSEKHIIQFENNRFLTVKTWEETLNAVKFELSRNNEYHLLADIEQIIGLCQTIDNNSFVPFQSEDFATSNAKRINSYYDIADKVIDELKKQNLIDTKNLTATPQKYGYSRYFKMNSFGFSLNVRFDIWEKDASTPFWLNIKDDISNTNLWALSNNFRSKTLNVLAKQSIISFLSNKKELYIPIFPLLDTTEDLVVMDVAKQITNLTDALK